MTDDDLDRMLRAARDDTAPLSDGLRARVLADAAASGPVPARGGLRRWFGGLIGVPAAAALGLWVGIAQADLVLDYVPGASAETDEELALLDDVFGEAWIEGDAG